MPLTTIRGVPLGRLAERIAAIPETERSLWATQCGAGAFGDYTLKRWPSREALARSVRMQQRRAPRTGDWRPVVHLADGEGY